jgi:hypothetical protein
LTYQTSANSIFISEQTNHQQPASSTFLSEQIITSHQAPAKRTSRASGGGGLSRWGRKASWAAGGYSVGCEGGKGEHQHGLA